MNCFKKLFLFLIVFGINVSDLNASFLKKYWESAGYIKHRVFAAWGLTTSVYLGFIYALYKVAKKPEENTTQNLDFLLENKENITLKITRSSPGSRSKFTIETEEGKKIPFHDLLLFEPTEFKEEFNKK